MVYNNNKGIEELNKEQKIRWTTNHDSDNQIQVLAWLINSKKKTTTKQKLKEFIDI